MGSIYPTNLAVKPPTSSPFVGTPANDNRPGFRVPSPANDNVRLPKSNVWVPPVGPQIAPGIKAGLRSIGRNIIFDIAKDIAGRGWARWRVATEGVPEQWIVPYEWGPAYGGQEYICMGSGGGGSRTSATTFAIVPGIDSANCIGAQAIATDPRTNLRIGFWEAEENIQDRYKHIRSYVRTAGQFSDPIPEYQPAVAPQPALWVKLAPIPRPRPQPEPWLSVSGEPSPVSPPISRPPPPGVKERKFVLAIGNKGPARIVNFIGEGPDIADCLHSALPKALQAARVAQYDSRSGNHYTRKASIWEKSKAVYENFDSIDIGAALACLAANQAEDNFYGRVGRLTGRANRRRGFSGGVALGPAL